MWFSKLLLESSKSEVALQGMTRQKPTMTTQAMPSLPGHYLAAPEQDKQCQMAIAMGSIDSITVFNQRQGEKVRTEVNQWKFSDCSGRASDRIRPWHNHSIIQAMHDYPDLNLHGAF